MSTFSNETKNTSTITHEEEGTSPSRFDKKKFDSAKFDKGQAGEGTEFSLEVKH